MLLALGSSSLVRLFFRAKLVCDCRRSNVDLDMDMNRLPKPMPRSILCSVMSLKQRRHLVGRTPWGLNPGQLTLMATVAQARFEGRDGTKVVLGSGNCGRDKVLAKLKTRTKTEN